MLSPCWVAVRDLQNIERYSSACSARSGGKSSESRVDICEVELILSRSVRSSDLRLKVFDVSSDLNGNWCEAYSASLGNFLMLSKARRNCEVPRQALESLDKRCLR